MFSAYGGRLGHTLAILQTLSLTTIHSLSRSYSLSRVFSSITSPPKRVGTHNGSFHCDEAFGCFLIRLTDKFSGAQIVQTRDAQHYGLEIIAKELKLDEGHQDVHRLYLAVYKNFIEAVDALDNGINQYDTDQLSRFVNNTNLTSRVERLNADWADFDQSMARENEALTAVVVMKSSL